MTTELQIIERAENAMGFASRKASLTELAKQSASIVQITNAAGRQECHAALMVLKNERIDIQKAGKEARDDATKFSKAVITKEKELIDVIDSEEARLQALRDQWDEARKAEREALARKELERVAAIRAKIDAIRSAPLNLLGKSAKEIEVAFTAVDEVDVSEFAGFEQAEATKAKEDAIDKLREMWTQQVAHESEQQRLRAEREELERLRKEQAEKLAEAEKQAAAERTEQDHLAKIEREREEAEMRAKLAAEAKVRAAEEARLLAERKEADRIRIEEEKSARKKLELEAAEADRIRKEKDAELQREREAFESQKAKDAQERLEKELAEITLLKAATEVYQFLVSKGLENVLVALKLKAALARETPTIAEAA